MIAAILKLAGTGMGITAFPGMLLYSSNTSNLISYIMVNAVAMAVAFCLTYFFFKVEE